MKSLHALAFLAAVTVSPSALAVDEVNVARGLSAAGAPLALHGYDPVAYQDDLYLNLNQDILATFEKDVPGSIKKAEANWRKIRHKAVGEL